MSDGPSSTDQVPSGRDGKREKQIIKSFGPETGAVAGAGVWLGLQGGEGI